jgi:hypothetical protein
MKLLHKSVELKKKWLLNVETAHNSSTQSMGLSYEAKWQAMQQWIHTGHTSCIPPTDSDNPNNPHDDETPDDEIPA